MPLVQIKNFNALVDNKPFSDESIKNNPKPYEKPVEMSRNHDYTRRNLLDHLYHQKCFKLIGLDLSRQKKCIFFFLNYLIFWMGDNDQA